MGFPENTPEWYWKKGLHDAIVVGTAKQEFGYDPVLRAANCVEIELDASQAMFDTGIKKISFFNCKILTSECDISGMWWIRDSLRVEGEKYTLEIDLGSAKNQCHVVLRFENCKVER